MAKQDYYEILGVSKNATEQEIKRAYKRLASKHHPDKNQGSAEAENKFKEINEAYEILSDQQKRTAYDQYGHQAFEGGGGRYSGNAGFDFQDIFKNFFGEDSYPQEQQGQSRSQKITLTLEEAIFGCKKTITINRLAKCKTCNGSGAKPGGRVKTCEYCNGSGKIRQQSFFGVVETTCPHCGGTGKIIIDRCTDCNGTGLVKETSKLQISIPKGVDNGTRMRLAGKGDDNPQGGPAGDLYLIIEVLEHSIFERDGVNLYCEVPITFVTATLGGQIEIPTLQGSVNLKIPKATQSGAMFRLRGKGVEASGYTGDLICKIVIETPVDLSEEQKELLLKFEESLDKSKHNPQQHGFLNSVKNFFSNLTK